MSASETLCSLCSSRDRCDPKQYIRYTVHLNIIISVYQIHYQTSPACLSLQLQSYQNFFQQFNKAIRRAGQNKHV